MCGQAGQGSPRKPCEDGLLVSSAHVRFGVIKRKRPRSPDTSSSTAALSFSSTAGRSWGLTEGEGGKEVEGNCNKGLIRWTRDSKLGKGGCGEWQGQHDATLGSRPIDKTSWDH